MPGYASAITYHPNGQVNAVTRLNNVVDTYEKDPNNMASGEPFDHITKFREAHKGAKDAVASLQGLVGGPRLTDAEHAYAQYLLRKRQQEAR